MTTRTTSKGSHAPKKKAESDGPTSKKTLRGKAVPASRKPRDLAERLPGEQHPGQTNAAGKLHDRPGSQPERVRHAHPGSTAPRRGSGGSH